MGLAIGPLEVELDGRSDEFQSDGRSLPVEAVDVWRGIEPRQPEHRWLMSETTAPERSPTSAKGGFWRLWNSWGHRSKCSNRSRMTFRAGGFVLVYLIRA